MTCDASSQKHPAAVRLPAGRLVGGAVPVLAVGGPAPDDSAVIRRAAVRAVIRRRTDLLLMHSPAAGDFKFPGGGLEVGESITEALVREVREECGRLVVSVGDPVLVVDEVRPGRDPGNTLMMRSTYLPCAVEDITLDQNLDDYERDLGLRPEWVDVSVALRVNRSLLDGGGAQPWVAREVAALTFLLRG